MVATNIQAIKFEHRKALVAKRVKALIDSGQCPSTLKKIESVVELSPRSLSQCQWCDVRELIDSAGVLRNTCHSR